MVPAARFLLIVTNIVIFRARWTFGFVLEGLDDNLVLRRLLLIVFVDAWRHPLSISEGLLVCINRRLFESGRWTLFFFDDELELGRFLSINHFIIDQVMFILTITCIIEM